MTGDGRYRLAALLRLRAEAERCAGADVAAALASLGREEAELSRRDTRFGERGREAAGARARPLARSGQALQWTARALCRLRGELQALEVQRDAQRARVEAARGAVERAQAGLAVARAERRGIELHRERWAGERRAARRAVLEAEQDDLARAREATPRR